MMLDFGLLFQKSSALSMHVYFTRRNFGPEDFFFAMTCKFLLGGSGFKEQVTLIIGAM